MTSLPMPSPAMTAILWVFMWHAPGVLDGYGQDNPKRAVYNMAFRGGKEHVA
jgi:hypothetical protein